MCFVTRRESLAVCAEGLKVDAGNKDIIKIKAEVSEWAIEPPPTKYT